MRKALNLRTVLRWLRWTGGVALSAVAIAATSCGGGGGGGDGTFAAKPMVLVHFLYVDRSLEPSFPTGTSALPRNAQIVFQFSEQVDPGSVNDQTIAIRTGAGFQSVPKGAFQVAGADVIFDPTLTQQGTPNPFGLDPVAQYTVELPGAGRANDVVRNRDDDPLRSSFFTTFATSDKFLRELTPPSIVQAYFLPGQDPLTKQVPGNAILALEFDEPMDPATFLLAAGAAPSTSDSIDIRYNDLPDPNINQANGFENVAIAGSFSWNASATTYFFVPIFSFGDKKYVFSIQVFQGLKDLAGNLLVNPRSFGPFTCDGAGKASGRVLAESFDTLADRDPTPTTADWGANVAGQLQGVSITSRRAVIACWQLANANQAGSYRSVPEPLIGFQWNTFVTNPVPPTALGRRSMWALSDAEVGANGAVTAVSWGPDSNQTFAAQYPDMVLRIGYQKAQSLSLSPSFLSNYQGTPVVIYKGPYSVSQSTNVGNEFAPAANTSGFAALQPLYDFTGYVNYPTLTSFFEWDQGDPLVTDDSVLVFDASVKEGDMFNRVRAWLATTTPTSAELLPGFPTRYLRGVYEDDAPNPPPSATDLNPIPGHTDIAFTITKRVSVAQCRFYTPGPTDPAGNVYPGPQSTQSTFGVKSNYEDAIVSPAIQAGGASVVVEYQGAFALDVTSSRTVINIARPSTSFTTAVNDCDGYPYLRWRITLVSNLLTNQVAKVNSVVVPIERLP